MKSLVSVVWNAVDKEYIEEFGLNVVTLSAKLTEQDSSREEIKELLQFILRDLIDGEDLQVEENLIYSTVFEIDLTYSTDYFGEVDVDYELELIDQALVGKLNEDGSPEYILCENFQWYLKPFQTPTIALKEP